MLFSFLRKYERQFILYSGKKDINPLKSEIIKFVEMLLAYLEQKSETSSMLFNIEYN